MKHKQEHSRSVSINDVIDQQEFNKLADILKEYSLQPLKIEKVRSVYKVVTDSRIYCLKKIKLNSYKKSEKGALLSKYLISKGFYNVVRYVKTKDDNYFVKKNHSAYYLTDWIKGREVKADDFEELKKCASLLADFHNASAGFTIENSKIDNNYLKWPSILKTKKEELIEIKAIIDTKKIKSAFDSKYSSLIDEFTNNIDVSLDLLEKSMYREVAMQANIANSVCHDSFYYQNILLKNNNKMYLIDLDSCIYDISINDLAKFIRRILFKRSYAWEFNIAEELIKEYTNKKPLSKEDYEILLALIIFPHKFWKLGAKRYKGKTKWPESKYLRKLKRIVRMNEKQNEFIAKYLNCFINKEIKKE
jgi:CotS family spore coat protein